MYSGTVLPLRTRHTRAQVLDGRKSGVACMRSRLASKWLELVDYGIGVLRVVEYDGVKADCGVGALPIKGFTRV
jgi:hypothetical protein